MPVRDSFPVYPRLDRSGELANNTEMTNETDDVKAVEQLGIARDGVVKELRKVIVGMEDVWKLTFNP